jgi:hypothetical protein
MALSCRLLEPCSVEAEKEIGYRHIRLHLSYLGLFHGMAQAFVFFAFTITIMSIENLPSTFGLGRKHLKCGTHPRRCG